MKRGMHIIISIVVPKVFEQIQHSSWYKYSAPRIERKNLNLIEAVNEIPHQHNCDTLNLVLRAQLINDSFD